MGVRGENVYPLEQAWASFNSIKIFWVSIIYQVLVSDVIKTQPYTHGVLGLGREKDMRYVNTYIIIHCDSENSSWDGCTEEGVMTSI